MADKFMKMGGRSEDGLSKPFKVTNDGVIHTQLIGSDTDYISLTKDVTLEPQASYTTNIIKMIGVHKLNIKWNSTVAYRIEVEYLNDDGTVYESELLSESTLQVDKIQFLAKYSSYQFKVTLTSTTARKLRLSMSKQSLEVESSNIVEVWENKTVLANSSVSTRLINTGGYPLNLGFVWSSATTMNVRIDAEYYTPKGVKLGEDKNIFYSKRATGIVANIIPFIPRYNLLKLVIHNDSANERRVNSLSLSRLKSGEARRLTQTILEPALINANKSINVAVPSYAYGVSLYLITRGHEAGVGANTRLRVRSAISNTISANALPTWGWYSEYVNLDGTGSGALQIMHIYPEAMYLQEYPPDSSAKSSSLLEMKLCPSKISEALQITIEVGGSFTTDQGINCEMVAEWHV